MVSLAWVRRRALIGPRGGKHQEGEERGPTSGPGGRGGKEWGDVAMRSGQGVLRWILSGIRMCM